MQAQSTHPELVRQAAGGDEQSFSELMSGRLPRVRAVALAITGSCAGSDDVTQEVAIRAWRKLSTLRDPQAFDAWLFTTARQRSKDWLRARSRRTRWQREAAEQPMPSVDTPLEVLSRVERQVQVERLLARLPEEHREVLTLYYMQGSSAREAARALEVSEPTFRKRLQRARARLPAREMARLMALLIALSETARAAVTPTPSRRGLGRALMAAGAVVLCAGLLFLSGGDATVSTSSLAPPVAQAAPVAVQPVGEAVEPTAMTVVLQPQVLKMGGRSAGGMHAEFNVFEASPMGATFAQAVASSGETTPGAAVLETLEAHPEFLDVSPHVQSEPWNALLAVELRRWQQRYAEEEYRLTTDALPAVIAAQEAYDAAEASEDMAASIAAFRRMEDARAAAMTFETDESWVADGLLEIVEGVEDEEVWQEAAAQLLSPEISGLDKDDALALALQLFERGTSDRAIQASLVAMQLHAHTRSSQGEVEPAFDAATLSRMAELGPRLPDVSGRLQLLTVLVEQHHLAGDVRMAHQRLDEAIAIRDAECTEVRCGVVADLEGIRKQLRPLEEPTTWDGALRAAVQGCHRVGEPVEAVDALGIVRDGRWRWTGWTLETPLSACLARAEVAVLPPEGSTLELSIR